MIVMTSLRDVLYSVLNDYHSAHDLRMVPIKVDDLKPLLEHRGYIDRFVWEEFSFNSPNIVAQVLCYEAGMGAYAGVGDYARVQYSSGLNYCWRRMAICKEMYQCILDVPTGNRITNVDQLLTLSELFVSAQYAAMKDFPPMHTEQLAEVAAVETLFPLELRLHYVADYDAGLLSDYQLALRFRIPERYIRLGMMPRYRAFVQSLRSGKLVAI